MAYRIDLSAANIAKFDKALKPYVDAAERVGGSARRSHRSEHCFTCSATTIGTVAQQCPVRKFKPSTAGGYRGLLDTTLLPRWVTSRWPT